MWYKILSVICVLSVNQGSANCARGYYTIIEFRNSLRNTGQKRVCIKGLDEITIFCISFIIMVADSLILIYAIDFV